MWYPPECEAVHTNAVVSPKESVWTVAHPLCAVFTCMLVQHISDVGWYVYDLI